MSGMEFTKATVRRAVKPYRCAWCHRRIEVGQAHVALVGVCEHHFFAERMCGTCAPECKEARKVWPEALTVDHTCRSAS